MNQTLIEKILSNKLGKTVRAGDEYDFPPDFITAYDYPGYVDVFEKQMKEDFGITQVSNPEKFVLFIDHFTPAGTPAQQKIHHKTRNFAKEFGFNLHEGRGIGHQVISELGYALPGGFVVHFDGHISTVGALGCLGIGVRHSLIEAFVKQTTSLVVPSTVKINLTGNLEKGVTARDIFHTIVEQIGPAGCRSNMIEFSGPGLKSLNMDERFTLCNLAMFLGGISAIMSTDERVYSYLKSFGLESDYKEMQPDNDASYSKTVSIDLNIVEPVIVIPPSPANTVRITDVLGTPIDVGYIGSCSSGRVTDFKQALEILENKNVSDNFRLNAVPTTTAIQEEISRLGLMSKLINAGASVHVPTCDFCIGQMSALTEGENAISTGPLNIPGRMGSNKAKIFTASPYTTAATAINGYITDPRTLL